MNFRDYVKYEIQKYTLKCSISDQHAQFVEMLSHLKKY